jgi:hypothetical protein
MEAEVDSVDPRAALRKIRLSTRSYPAVRCDASLAVMLRINAVAPLDDLALCKRNHSMCCMFRQVTQRLRVESALHTYSSSQTVCSDTNGVGHCYIAVSCLVVA